MAYPVYCNTIMNYSGGEVAIPVAVDIFDGRAAIDDVDYDTNGFTLMRHESTVTDWTDQSHLEAVYSPEIASLAREMTGCDHTVVYSPIIRSPESARQTADFHPIEFAHSDYTDDYLAMITEPGRPYQNFLEPLLAANELSPEHVERAARVSIVQFWRNTGPERPDFPIAFCDATTVPRSQLNDFLVTEYGGERLEFHTYGIKPPADPADHRWFTFPSMQIDEVVAFRTYDSDCARNDRPFWTPHSAFRDPNAGDDAPPRESVEMRVLCLFD